MEKYVPDMYQQSIYTIDYQMLLDKGIKCLLFDLDNTLVPVTDRKPTKKLKELFDDLKNKGFKVIIFSNSHRKRLKPFKEELNVDCCASAKKPFKEKFLLVLNEYHYNVNEVAIIGDQILTDILGGNKVGILTVLVNPISNRDFLITKINRFREKRIMKKLRDKNLFSKGRYYEL